VQEAIGTETVGPGAAPVRHRHSTIRAVIRLVGSLLIVSGVLLAAWALVVWRWQDPFTALYTHIQQQRLATSYEHRVQAYEPPPNIKVKVEDPAAAAAAVAREARAYRRSLHTGDPVGRLQIGRLGLNMIVVQGTDHETLKKGPGHYETTGLPGEQRLIYVAGHRTTYLAPFAHIDSIKNGDYITFTMPYGTFSYRAVRHYVVASTDLAVLVNHGSEILRLQACHPRFFATHRYIVDARLVAFKPRGGTSWLAPPKPKPKSAVPS
jgi:sortase A